MKRQPSWARRLVERFARRRILVAGDLMLDRYIYGAVHRISPEAPVPVVRVQSEKFMPGGAANVARNLRALGAHVYLHGVLGKDAAGADLLRVLRSDDVVTRGVVCLAGAATTVKTRILAERQQVVRVDWEKPVCLSGAALRRICAALRAAVPAMDGIILADYAKGALPEPVMTAILEEARRYRVPVALDPKDHRALDVRGLTVATPNRKEAFALARVPESAPAADPLQDEALLGVAASLLDTWRPAFLVITLGAQGMLVVGPGRPPRHVHAVAREVFDVSGAGDTVIAALLLALASGASHEQAADLANGAAGVVVGKLGTATCSAEELLDYRARIAPHSREDGSRA